MRKDMNKVLTTRPRVGGNCKNRRFDKLNTSREVRYFKGAKVDLSPKRESIRKRHKTDGINVKEFTDHIEPLRRYLVSQVGRPWDDVWSDICQVLKGTSLQALHVKQHVKWEVAGIPHSGEKNPFGFRKLDEPFQPQRGRVVYVDEKGILRKNPGR